MIGATLLPSLDVVFHALARASVEGGLFVLATWIITRAIPRMPAGARATLWWIASARFVVSLAGIAPLGVPVTLPAPLAIAATAPADAALSASRGPSTPLRSSAGPTVPAAAVAMAPAGSPVTRRTVERAPGPSASSPLLPSWPWTVWVALTWLGLLVVALARIVLALRRSARAVRHATRIDAAGLPAIRRVAQRFGLTGDPDVRISDSLRSPQLIWAGHAIVLLPSAALRTWTASDVELALAHEYAHLRRHDLAWGFGVAFVARAFAFHPLARLAAREYALAREAACDAEVLARTNASPFDYGKLLLALGVTRRPVLSLSSAAWSGRSLKRRLVMLEHHSASGRVNTRWIVIPAALCAGLVGLTAAPPGPRPQSQPSQPTVAAAPSAPTPTAAVIAGPVLAGRDQTPPPPPPPPKPAVPPRPPAPPPPPPHAHAGLHVESMDEVADAWVYLSAGHSFQHGSRHDRRIAEAQRRGGEPVFWFARDGKEYVIRDKATLDRVEQLLAPEQTLADGQGDVAELQAKLAHEQALIAAKQAAILAEEAKLRAEMMAKRPDQDIDEAKAGDIEARARDYEKQMQALETEMHRHEEHVRALEPEHARVAQQMEHRSQELETRMVQASRELKELLTKAIASGVALGVR